MTIDDHLRLSRNLKILRKAVRLSQTKLAETIGICRSSYCQLENGDRLPDLDTLHSLSALYQIPMDVVINCEIQDILQDYFFCHNTSKEEQHLLRVYSRLSQISKGRLLERADELAQLDLSKRTSPL